MKKKLGLILLLVLTTKYGMSQFFDNYGFNLGSSYSTQFWGNQRMDYKLGLQVLLSAEKKINKLFSIKPEFGYIQKGFKYNYLVIHSDPGSPPMASDKNAIFHDLALNIGFKITPIICKCMPYAVIGLRGDYMVAYKDVVFEEYANGLKSTFDMYHKANLGGLLGIGIDFSDKYYLEFEYNPSFTSSSKSADIIDDCWGVKFGVNINKLIKK